VKNRIVQLGEVITIDRATASEAECRTLPYVGLEHIEKGAGNFTADFSCQPETLLATKVRFTPQHVLYGKLRPNLNKVALPHFDGVCTTEIFPLLPKPQSLDRRYLYAVLLSQRFVKWASNSVAGANLPRLAPERLRGYELELPDLTEQQRIAGQLEQADRLRRTRRYALELTDTFLPAAFLELFGNSSFSCVALEELATGKRNSFVNGPFGSDLLTSELTDSGVPVIYIRDISSGRYERTSSAFVTPTKAAELEFCNLKPGDVLVAKVGAPPGIAAIYPATEPEGIVTQDVIRIRPNTELVSALYLQGFLNSRLAHQEMTKIMVEGTRLRFGLGQFKGILVPVPPLHLQQEFTVLVEQVERLRAVQREASRQAEHLFAPLLDRAFNG
jgi:type I restriction enzyme S subunit